MRLNGQIALLPMFLAIVFVVGCGSGQRQNAGFLADYSKLKPSDRIKGAMVDAKPDTDLRKYRSFMVDPVGIHFAPDAKGTAVDPAVLKELSDYFRSRLIEELGKHYTIVDKPATNVMQLRVAITDVERTIRAMNIHPATKLSGVGLGGASCEAMGDDAATGELLFQFMHTRAGDRLALVAGLEEWGHAKQAIDFWVKSLIDRLDEMHGQKEND